MHGLAGLRQKTKGLTNVTLIFDTARSGQGRTGKIQRRFEQGVACSPELWRCHQHLHHGAHVPLGCQKRFAQPLHQGRRRLVCHKKGGQPRGNPLCGGGVPRQQADSLLAFGLALVGKAAAQQRLVALVVQALGKTKAFAAPQVDRPAGENAGQLAHVGLGVAAVDAQRVQLHQLPGVVFIQAAVVALGLVQVQQHGRVLGTGQQQIFKAAQRIRADDVNHVMPDERPHGALADKHIEVVKPKLGHARQQRVFKRRVAAGHQTPGGRTLSHFAAENLWAARHEWRHLARGGWGGLLTQGFSGFAFGMKVARDVIQGGIETRQFGRNVGRTTAGRISCLHLLQGPGARRSQCSLGQRRRGRITKA